VLMLLQKIVELGFEFGHWRILRWPEGSGYGSTLASPPVN
jgi:hypothetical protein